MSVDDGRENNTCYRPVWGGITLWIESIKDFVMKWRDLDKWWWWWCCREKQVLSYDSCFVENILHWMGLIFKVFRERWFVWCNKYTWIQAWFVVERKRSSINTVYFEVLVCVGYKPLYVVFFLRVMNQSSYELKCLISINCVTQSPCFWDPWKEVFCWRCLL